MFHLFEILLYQPFLNLLLIIFWSLNKIPHQSIDMGVTVIIFTIIIRILLLPISLAAHRSEADRRKIAKSIQDIQLKYKDNPVAMKEETKKVFRGSRTVVAAEIVSLVIQVSISLILWAIFSHGLSGQDAHLVYPFMPKIFPIPPEKLVFMGYDLTVPHWQLNLFQSLMIFILETLSMYISPYPVQKGDVVRYQFFLPLVSFAIFAFLPAGKKLFVITTLIFSIGLTIVLAVRKKVYDLSEKLKQQDIESMTPPEDKVVVGIK